MKIPFVDWLGRKKPNPFLDAQNIFGALRKAGFEPRVVYDVGSAGGQWSRRLTQIFPAANFYLFEPLVDSKPHYQENCALLCRRSNIHLLKIALSDSDGLRNIFSDEKGWGASLLPTQAVGSLCEKLVVPVKKLETIVSEQKLPVPDLVKMDVQGSELKVLHGATALLGQIQVIQTEIWFRRDYGSETPLFHEVSEFLGQFDFLLLEICAPYYAPAPRRDLTSADAFFIKSNLLAELADKLPSGSLAGKNF